MIIKCPLGPSSSGKELQGFVGGFRFKFQWDKFIKKKKKSLNGIKMFTCPIWKLNDSQISLCICSMTAAIKFVYIELLSKKVDNSRAQFYVKSVLV